MFQRGGNRELRKKTYFYSYSALVFQSETEKVRWRQCTVLSHFSWCWFRAECWLNSKKVKTPKSFGVDTWRFFVLISSVAIFGRLRPIWSFQLVQVGTWSATFTWSFMAFFGNLDVFAVFKIYNSQRFCFLFWEFFSIFFDSRSVHFLFWLFLCLWIVSDFFTLNVPNIIHQNLKLYKNQAVGCFMGSYMISWEKSQLTCHEIEATWTKNTLWFFLIS